MGNHAGVYLGGLFRSSSAANIGRHRKPAFQRVARAPKPKREPKPLKMDIVAEHLSNGLELSQIAQIMGITIKAVEHHFAKIRKQLGGQAA